MRRRTALGAALAVLLLPALTAAKCGSAGHGGGPHINKPEKGHEDEAMKPEEADEDWPVDGHNFRELRISVWVDPTAWPYSVKITATDHSDNNKTINLGSHTVDKGQFVCPISFEAGHDLSVKVEFIGKKAPKQGAISSRERNARGAQVFQTSDLANRRTAEWDMSPRRR